MDDRLIGLDIFGHPMAIAGSLPHATDAIRTKGVF
jgi:hypothetical protein